MTTFDFRTFRLIVHDADDPYVDSDMLLKWTNYQERTNQCFNLPRPMGVTVNGARFETQRCWLWQENQVWGTKVMETASL